MQPLLGIRGKWVKHGALRHVLMASVGSLIVAVGLSGSASAAAQTSKETAKKTNSGANIEEVLVTAQKRTQRLIDVPVAASVVTATEINRYAVTDLTHIQSLTPGVMIARTAGGTPGSSIFIRGIGVFGPDYGSSEPVSIVIDGVPVSRGHVIDAGYFDLQSIQVLKGPQSVFFGKNTPAGAILLDSKNPGDTFGGYLQAGYGINEQDPTLEGAVSIPISNTFAVRFAARLEDMQGGYMTNRAKPIAIDPIPDPIFGGVPTPLPGSNFSNYPQTKEIIGRFTAVWKPTQNFRAIFKFLMSYRHDDASAGAFALTHCANGMNPAYISALTGTAYQDTNATCGYSHTTNDATPPAPVLAHFVGAPQDGKYYTIGHITLASLTLHYNLRNVSLTSETGMFKLNSGEFDNYDMTVFAETPDMQREQTETWTEEARAETHFNFPVNFTVGGFFEHSRRGLWNTNRIFLLPGLPAGIPNQTQFAGASNSMIDADENNSEDFSFFGQLAWKVTKTVEVTAGGRWTDAHKDTNITQPMQWLDVFYLAAPGGPKANSSLMPAGSIYHIRTKYQNFSPQATISWHLRDNLMVYGAYKTGFLSGGIANPGVVTNYYPLAAPLNTAPNAPTLNHILTTNLTFAPEKSKGFEFGAKGSFFNNRLSGDVTLYHYMYYNLQVATFHPTTTTFTIGNAGRALDEGIEINGAYSITDSLSMHGGFEYAFLRYGQYNPAPCYPGQTAAQGCVNGAQNLSGRTFSTPPLTFMLGADYERPVWSGYDMGLTADVTTYSRSPSVAGQPNTADPAHTIFNASARLYSEDGHWEYAVIGTNLTDAVYSTILQGKPLGAPQDIWGTVNQGREVRLQVTYHFGG